MAISKHFLWGTVETLVAELRDQVHRAMETAAQLDALLRKSA